MKKFMLNDKIKTKEEKIENKKTKDEKESFVTLRPLYQNGIFKEVGAEICVDMDKVYDLIEKKYIEKKTK
jgi:hypothetical protein